MSTGERVVTVGGLECMCGGTHVKNTLDIRAATATKIKKVSIGDPLPDPERLFILFILSEQEECANIIHFSRLAILDS